jgi:murein DD-endopeptidase MepM/ murein hydrolase activator NlpD
MAQKESRLAQILRQELQAGTNLPQALAMANVASLREKGDYRNLFPKSGVLGQVLRASLGKGYQYGRSAQSTSAARGSAGSSAGALSAGAIRLTARNSMFLPVIARDMNIMKQNIASLVRATGKRAFAGTERDYLKMGAKKPRPGAGAGSSSSAGGGDSALSKLFSGAGFAASLASGIVSNIFSVMGSMLSFGGSLISGAVGIIGSVLGGALNIGGGILGGLLGGLGSVVRGMGIFGIIALAGAGFLMYQISKNITGELSFDKILNYIKDSLGFNKGETFREALFRAFGFLDKKTGLNTQGTFVTVEKEFVGWLAYSKTILESIVTTLDAIGKIAVLEMQKAFIQYGTGVIKILAAVGGTAMGAQGGFDVASILASLALIPVTGGASGAVGIGSILARTLIGTGMLGAGTVLGGYFGFRTGEKAGDAITKLLTDPDLTEEQRNVLLKMEGNSKFTNDLDVLGSANKSLKSISKYDGLSDEQLKQTSPGAYDIRMRNKKKKEDILKEHETLFKEFTNAFGDIDITKDRTKIRADAAVRNIEGQIEAEKNRIPTVDQVKESASKRADDAKKNYVPPSPTRVAPVSNFKASRVSSDYGMRKSPITGEMEMHGGIDITGKAGESIYSSIDGEVIEVGYDKDGKGTLNGNYIFIKGPDGTITKYLHLQDRSALKVGDKVTAGQAIGIMGNTGQTKGRHLHFEVTDANGKTIDPMPFLNNMTPAPVVAVAPPPKPSVASDSSNKDKFVGPVNKFDGVSDTDLMMQIVGDIFGDITKVLSGMMNNLSKGGSEKVSPVSQGEVIDFAGTQTRLSLEGRVLYSMGTFT